MSGHSKWSQIKHKKAASDAKRGQLFSKLIREITVAAQQGGPNPDANHRLRAAMERARDGGLAKDNIARALERASGRGAETELSEFLYEAASPGRVAILIEGITDNKNRTHAELKHLLAEHGGRLAEQGSLVWNFEKVGLIECRREHNPTKAAEEIELAIIDSGARDFRHADRQWLIETEFSSRDAVRTQLERRGIALASAAHDYKPRVRLEIAPAELEKIELLLDALVAHDDVQEVYTNLQD